ncbi:hypothetical protein MCAMS1_01643 [biofilm metagenome]
MKPKSQETAGQSDLFNTRLADLLNPRHELYQLACFDKLTGLSNRTFYQKHVNNIINSAKRHNKQLALLFLELDEFKYINDSFGHDVGDQFLQVIAERISLFDVEEMQHNTPHNPLKSERLMAHWTASTNNMAGALCTMPAKA